MSEPLKEFKVELYELYSQYYIVRAVSEKEAIKRALEGYGEIQDNALDYIEIADKYAAPGMPSGVRSVEEV